MVNPSLAHPHQPKIGVCSWSLQPADAVALVDWVQQAELDAVQLALNPLAQGDPNWRSAIERLRAAGIAVLSGMLATRGEDYSTLETIRETGGVRPDETWDDNQKLTLRIADLAAEHTIPVVTLHAGFLPEDATDPERAKLIDRLRWMADAFAERDVDIAFETGQETARTLLDVLGELDRPNVGVNFDPANMILYGMGDPIEALCELKPRVRQVHIKDAIPAEQPGEWGREVAAGTGAVDWPAFFSIAADIDPPIDFIIEREAGGERLDDVRSAVRLIRAHGAMSPHVES